MAPHHPLAAEPEPLKDERIQQHRAVAVADSIAGQRGLTFNLLSGQHVFTVASMQDKLDAQLRGLGAGFVPECLAGPYIETGRLRVKRVERPERVARLSYAWRGAAKSDQGRALQWWLSRLESPATRTALLGGRRGV